MMAVRIVLALAVLLAVAHAADPQQAAPTPFGTLNGLYQKSSGSPLVVYGFRVVQTAENGEDLLLSGAQLTHPPAGAGGLVGQATAVYGRAKYSGLTFDRYPTFSAWIIDVASNHTSDVTMVQADADTVYVYPLGATVFNPPNATHANSVWARVGQAPASK